MPDDGPIVENFWEAIGMRRTPPPPPPPPPNFDRQTNRLMLDYRIALRMRIVRFWFGMLLLLLAETALIVYAPNRIVAICCSLPLWIIIVGHAIETYARN